jgi:molybdopterin-synthase adenylyltransferase
MHSMNRPRVKPEHAPYRIKGGKIRIGGVSFGIAAEIEDPDGSVWAMLSAMDGSRSLDEVVAHVAEAYPGERREQLAAAAQQLIESGYVEDNFAPAPANLTSLDFQRHARSVGFYRWLDLTPRGSSWEPQSRIAEAKVTILGVGGTGGIAAMGLAASGVGRLHCVDPDLVELSNLNRQVIYSEKDIGQAKADAAVARLQQLNSDISVTGERTRVDGVDAVARLADDCDVLILAADQPPAIRMWANRACLQVKRPWIDACYHGPLVQVGAFVPQNGPCWECTRLELRDRDAIIGANTADGDRRLQSIMHAVGAVSAGISGNLAAHLAIALITGIPPITPGQINAVNLAALDAPFSFTVSRHPECQACGYA